MSTNKINKMCYHGGLGVHRSKALVTIFYYLIAIWTFLALIADVSARYIAYSSNYNLTFKHKSLFALSLFSAISLWQKHVCDSPLHLCLVRLCSQNVSNKSNQICYCGGLGVNRSKALVTKVWLHIFLSNSYMMFLVFQLLLFP